MVQLAIGVTARSGDAPVKEVLFVVQSGPDAIHQGTLEAAGRGRYETTTTLRISALDVANYTLLVYAVDAAARLSGEIRGTVEYVRIFEPGQPPALDELTVPDTLRRPAPGQPAATLLLAARASDPDGHTDIEKVEFWNIEAPDQRLLLCDDGAARPCGGSPESGDGVAGDGVFTRRVFVQSTNRTGVNTLVFQATDRAGLVSPELRADIVIISS